MARPPLHATFLLAAFLVAHLAAGDLAQTLNGFACEGSPTAPTLELCFTPTVNLGPVDLVGDATVDPNVTFDPSQVGVLGIVRLTVVSGFVEIPAASFDSADPCAPLSVLPFNCTVVVAVPISNPGPGADPGLTTASRRLGELVIGTLTIRLNGQPALVVPGYADLVCGVGGNPCLADPDGDGVDSTTELSASPRANPFYKYSKPGVTGPHGFPADWDADGWKNESEAGISDPLQRCSTPSNPNGWSATNPTHTCES